jgi:hypothetical protein
MLKLTTENAATFSGPLAHRPTFLALQELVDRSRTLEQVAAGVDAIPGLTYYKGSMHVAIHTKTNDGKLSPTRWAIITEQGDIKTSEV